MIKINELIEKYSQMSKAELLFHGRTALEGLLTHFTALTRSQDDALSVILAFAAASVNSDGNFTKPEITYCAELLHLSQEHALSLLTQAATPKKADAAQHLFDACEGSIKLLLLDFCLCFVASDKNVCPQESSFIKSLVI